MHFFAIFTYLIKQKSDLYLHDWSMLAAILGYSSTLCIQSWEQNYSYHYLFQLQWMFCDVFRFGIQFKTGPGPNADMLFRFCPKWVNNRHEVIGNSRISNKWGSHLTFAAGSSPFAIGTNFQVMIVIESDGFKVNTNFWNVVPSTFLTHFFKQCCKNIFIR